MKSWNYDFKVYFPPNNTNENFNHIFTTLLSRMFKSRFSDVWKHVSCFYTIRTCKNDGFWHHTYPEIIWIKWIQYLKLIWESLLSSFWDWKGYMILSSYCFLTIPHLFNTVWRTFYWSNWPTFQQKLLDYKLIKSNQSGGNFWHSLKYWVDLVLNLCKSVFQCLYYFQGYI